MMKIAKLKSYGGSGHYMVASILNPAALDDFEPMLESLYEVPFHKSVQLTAKKPLFWVYFGAHIETLEQAKEVVPNNAWGEHLLKFFPSHQTGRGGTIAFQRYEDSPIEFEYIYRGKPTYVKPEPRVRMQSEAQTIEPELHDTALTEVLKDNDGDTTGTKIDRVARLLELGRHALEQALKRSKELSKKKKSSGAAARTAAEILNMSERLAHVGAERGMEQEEVDEVARTATTEEEEGAHTGDDQHPQQAQVASTRVCGRCQVAPIDYPAAACQPCVQQLKRLSCNHKMPLGVIESHGYNSFKQSVPCVGEKSNYPITERMASNLYPGEYADSDRYFDRRNWISRAPSMVARYPHEYFLNGQDKLPHAFPRPSQDIRALGPSGAVFTSRPRGELKFGGVIDEFEADHTDVSKHARLWDLVERCCAHLGVPVHQLPVPDAGALQLRKAKRDNFANAEKAAKAAAKKATTAARAAAEAATQRVATAATAAPVAAAAPAAAAPAAAAQAAAGTEAAAATEEATAMEGVTATEMAATTEGSAAAEAEAAAVAAAVAAAPAAAALQITPGDVPPGFRIAAAPPSAEQLAFSRDTETPANALVGRSILTWWEGHGWCLGRIAGRNLNARAYMAIDGQRVKINFFIYYEIDGPSAEPLKSVLRLSEYAASANEMPWVLLEASDA